MVKKNISVIIQARLNSSRFPEKILSKIKNKTILEILIKRILKSKVHKFKIDGKYLMDIGMEQGALMGKVLKKIEEEWIKNNFKITKDQIKEIVKSNSN